MQRRILYAGPRRRSCPVSSVKSNVPAAAERILSDHCWGLPNDLQSDAQRVGHVPQCRYADRTYGCLLATKCMERGAATSAASSRSSSPRKRTANGVSIVGTGTLFGRMIQLAAGILECIYRTHDGTEQRIFLHTRTAWRSVHAKHEYCTRLQSDNGYQYLRSRT